MPELVVVHNVRMWDARGERGSMSIEVDAQSIAAPEFDDPPQAWLASAERGVREPRATSHEPRAMVLATANG
jgi:hypothetical protein